MNYVEQEIRFRTELFYGRDVPLALSAPLLRRLESIARPSVRMILEGTSASVGARPAWLERASDIRTLGFSAKDGYSILHVKAPMLGEAAPQLFEQTSFWPSAASSEDTALQVIGNIARAVRGRETGSDLFDRGLLRHFSSWGGLFRNGLQSVEFHAGTPSGFLSAINAQVATNAQGLSDETPSPRQVRVEGKLDMVRHSTRSFGLLLSDGTEVRGVLLNGSSEVLQGHFGKQITALGKAIYRPSGTLLRIDASEILAVEYGRQAFTKIPPSLTQSRKPERRMQSAKAGVAAFFGSWPGEESDRELLKALEEVRG